MAGMTKRQAQIQRRRRIRELEAKRDRAIANMDKAKETLSKARSELSNARKAG